MYNIKLFIPDDEGWVITAKDEDNSNTHTHTYKRGRVERRDNDPCQSHNVFFFSSLGVSLSVISLRKKKKKKQNHQGSMARRDQSNYIHASVHVPKPLVDSITHAVAARANQAEPTTLALL